MWFQLTFESSFHKKQKHYKGLLFRQPIILQTAHISGILTPRYLKKQIHHQIQLPVYLDTTLFAAACLTKTIPKSQKFNIKLRNNQLGPQLGRFDLNWKKGMINEMSLSHQLQHQHPKLRL